VRNGSLALGLGVLAIALLAASGKLGELWRAIMNAETQGGTSGGTSGSGISGSAGQSIGRAVIDTSTAFAPDGQGIFGGTTAAAAAAAAVLAGRQGASNTTIYAGANPALDDVFAKWPAGHQTEWNAFMDCFRSTGSVQVCASKGLVLSSEGKS
jgi:hypothetical protein